MSVIRPARPEPETGPRRSDAAPRSTPLPTWSDGDDQAIPTIGEIGLNHFAPYLLNRLSARWNGALQDLLKGLDLSTTQFRALAVLAVASGITVNELAIFAITEQSTMSRTLDTLEEQELIRRRPKPGDMRVREVFITEQGLALFSRIWPDIYGLFARYFNGIDEAEFRGFIATLHKILRNTRGVER